MIVITEYSHNNGECTGSFTVPDWNQVRHEMSDTTPFGRDLYYDSDSWYSVIEVPDFPQPVKTYKVQVLIYEVVDGEESLVASSAGEALETTDLQEALNNKTIGDIVTRDLQENIGLLSAI